MHIIENKKNPNSLLMSVGFLKMLVKRQNINKSILRQNKLNRH
jgi:hypothetical protein